VAYKLMEGVNLFLSSIKMLRVIISMTALRDDR